MKTQQIFRNAKIAFALSLFLVGCGAQKNSSSDVTSGSTSLSSTSTLASARCSHDIDNLTDISIRLRIYEDGTSGQTRNDLIRVKFDRFPSQFSNSDTSAVQLWTRTIDSVGNWGTWIRVPFYVERYTAAGVSRTPYTYTDLTWAQLKQLGSYFGVSNSTGQELFQSLVFLAQLPDVSISKVLTVKTYMTSTQPETSALIPQFKANPKEYAKDKPQALVNMHPLGYLWNNSYTEEQYQYEANQFCF